MLGLVLANADNPSVLVELKIANPAADMGAQIDASFLQTCNGAIISRATCQRAIDTGALDQKSAAKVLLEHRLHHRAAADVADANTENLFHRSTLAPVPMPSSSNRKRELVRSPCFRARILGKVRCQQSAPFCGRSRVGLSARKFVIR